MSDEFMLLTQKIHSAINIINFLYDTEFEIRGIRKHPYLQCLEYKVGANDAEAAFNIHESDISIIPVNIMVEQLINTLFGYDKDKNSVARSYLPHNMSQVTRCGDCEYLISYDEFGQVKCGRTYHCTQLDGFCSWATPKNI